MSERRKMHTLAEADPLNRADRARSNFVRELVQGFIAPRPPNQALPAAPSKCIVQFWDDPGHLPDDVRECMDSWKRLEQFGFTIKVFNEKSAREFIRANLGTRHENAFVKCYHPSMKSDYFRYSYIFVNGGFYVDADDVYLGTPIDHLFTDGRLKLQPFCYDVVTGQMVPPSLFVNRGANKISWIFYFNTTPLIAGRRHPIVERALINCTISLEEGLEGELPEVQSTTGPGNLTKSVVQVINEHGSPAALLIVHDWETISVSKWPLSYRGDKRNWRLSNQQEYRPTRSAEDQ